MSQEIINIGTVPNDDTGDTIRVGASKTNNNFTELYSHHSNVTSNVANLQTIVYGFNFEALSTANGAFDKANDTYSYAYYISVNAKAAFDKANGASNTVSRAYDTANAAFGKANAIPSVFAKVNSTLILTSSAYDFANGISINAAFAFQKANIAYGAANNAPFTPRINTIFTVANAAFDYANTLVLSSLAPVFVVANAAYTSVNTAFAVANAAYNYANNIFIPNITPAFNVANAAFDKANAANVLAYDTGAGANNYASAVGVSTNAYTSVTYSTLTQFSSLFGVSNGGFNKANSAYDLANAAYVYANTIIGESTNLTPVFTVANASFDAANSISTNTTAAFTKANSAYDLANGAYIYANTIIGESTNLIPVFTKANAAYDLANAAYVYANTIIGESTNLTPVFTVANAAFNAANNASNNANTSELTSNGFVVSLNTAGYVTFGQTGYSVPDVVDRSGEKLVLWDQSGFYSYSIGIEPDAMWLGVDEGLSTKGFTWYTGNTRILELTRSGNVNFSANGYIFNRANSSGDGYGFDTLEIYPDNRYGQALVIDPTYAYHIHLRGSGAQDDSITDLFIGGERSHFRIPSGLNPSPIITSNNVSWIFYEDGGLQFTDSSIQYTAYSNSVYDTANAAFNAANNAVTDFSPAYNKANDAYTLANDAYNYANTLISENTNLTDVFNVANAAFNLSNGVSTNTTSAFVKANGAATNAAAAFTHANSALQNTTGTFAGSLTVTGNTIVDGIAPGYAPNRPAFRVHGSGTTNDLSITVNGTGCLTSNNWTVDFNQGTYLSNTNGVFIAPVTGLYQVNIVARNSDYPSGISQLGVTKNGTSGGTVGGECILMVEFAANSSMNHAGSSTIINLTAGDTLACKVLAGEINFDNNDNWSVAYIG